MSTLEIKTEKMCHDKITVMPIILGCLDTSKKSNTAKNINTIPRVHLLRRKLLRRE